VFQSSLDVIFIPVLHAMCTSRQQPPASPATTTEVKECVELYLHSPNKSSWRGA